MKDQKRSARRVAFRAANGSRFTQAEINRYGPVVQRLAEKHGAVSPEMLVVEGSNPRSPLHAYFEWEDRRAAKKWRLIQARELLRSIVIVPIIHGKPQAAVRAFFNVKVAGCPTRDRAYVSAGRAGREARLRQQVVAAALHEAESWLKRYRRYRELSAISIAIERTLAAARRDEAA